MKTFLGLLLSFIFLFGIVSADTKKKYRIKIATSWPSNFPIFGDTPENFKKYVETMSSGRIEVRIDNANKTKAPFGVFDLVKSGQYEMGHSASYYWTGKDNNTIYFSTMPFGMLPIEQYSWFYYGGGLELMNEVYNKHNLYSFLGGNTGVQMGGWFRKEIKTLDDLKGLKMRLPGFAGEVLSKVGVNIVNIAPGELYTAMDRGTIDAVEWVGPALDLRLGLNKVAKYYYTGWQEPATELQFLVNKKFMDSLPKDLQEIMKQAMKLAAYNMLIESTYENGKSWEIIKQDPEIQVKSFPNDVMKALVNASNELIKERNKNNPTGAKIYKSQQDYLAKVRPWTLISDYSYLKNLEENK